MRTFFCERRIRSKILACYAINTCFVFIILSFTERRKIEMQNVNSEG